MQIITAVETRAAVKGTMINAHIEWAKAQISDLNVLRAALTEETSALLTRPILQIQWVPLRSLVEIDEAIAQIVGGNAKEIYKELGRYSARYSLKGIFKSFIAGEPHRFFDKMSILHEQYMNFGRSKYEKSGARAGRIILDRYVETSTVYCASASGFYEEALVLMKAPGPIVVVEKQCQCWGHMACIFELAW